ncbi:SseB family protein [Sinomonas mesophila]|uniref:SseB family protein n=1 Tax=Sinomonas mesophila TaxID=1531955 RepID=UPI000986F14F|nr:SseB family protein [Sinomonas mesophila]
MSEEQTHGTANGPATGTPAEDGGTPPHLDPAPLTELEEALAAASEIQGGEGENAETAPILAFLNGLVCLLVPEPVPGQTEYVEPLVLTNSEGKPLVAAFTHRARIRPDFLDHAPTVVETQGAVLLQNLGTELGVVLNPGSAYGFELSTEHVAAVLRDFRPAEPGETAPGGAGPDELGEGRAGE